MPLHCGQQKHVFILFCFLDETVSQAEKSVYPWLLPTRTDCGGQLCIRVTLSKAAAPPRGCY